MEIEEDHQEQLSENGVEDEQPLSSEGAETKIAGILDYIISMLENMREKGLGLHDNGLLLGKTDKEKLIEDGNAFLSDLAYIEKYISAEIPKLVKYVPFERSSYGTRKDAEIAEKKLFFAKDCIRKLVEDISLFKADSEMVQ